MTQECMPELPPTNIIHNNSLSIINYYIIAIIIYTMNVFNILT